MPWSKDHKDATRRRIVEAASAAFRGRGVAGVGVAEVMKSAGLTHGGFYAHFASKEDLVSEAVDAAARQTRERLAHAAGKAAPDARLAAIAAAYLSTSHRRHPEDGCPVAAMASELARDDGAAGEAFARAVRERLSWLEEQDRDRPAAERRRRAAGAYATMVGALTLARALGDDGEAESYLARVRHFLDEALG